MVMLDFEYCASLTKTNRIKLKLSKMMQLTFPGQPSMLGQQFWSIIIGFCTLIMVQCWKITFFTKPWLGLPQDLILTPFWVPTNVTSFTVIFCTPGSFISFAKLPMLIIENKQKKCVLILLLCESSPEEILLTMNSRNEA